MRPGRKKEADPMPMRRAARAWRGSAIVVLTGDCCVVV